MTSLGQNELIKDNKTATITCQSPTISSTSPKAYQYINDSCCPTRWRPNLLDLQHVCIVFTPDHCAATIFWIYRTTLAIWRRLRGTLTHHTQLENRYKIIIEPRKDGLQAHQGCIVQWKKFIETGSFNKTHKITSFGWHDLYNVLLPILREYQIHVYLNTLRLRQNGRNFTGNILKCIFLNENVWISIKISLKFVPSCPINNIPALVWIMVWHQPGDKPLSESMVLNLLTHVCVTRPQGVNHASAGLVYSYTPELFHPSAYRCSGTCRSLGHQQTQCWLKS